MKGKESPSQEALIQKIVEAAGQAAKQSNLVTLGVLISYDPSTQMLSASLLAPKELHGPSFLHEIRDILVAAGEVAREVSASGQKPDAQGAGKAWMN